MPGFLFCVLFGPMIYVVEYQLAMNLRVILGMLSGQAEVVRLGR